MSSDEIQRVRRAALARILEKHTPTALAKLLGHSSHSFISQMNAGSRPISEKTARQIERALGLEQWEMDRPAGGELPFASTNRQLIASVILAVEKELENFRGALTNERRAKLIAEVYEKSAPLGRVDSDYLKRLIELLT